MSHLHFSQLFCCSLPCLLLPKVAITRPTLKPLLTARGWMLGPDQPVILHLLDIPFATEALEGVRMELVDAAYPLVKGAYDSPVDSAAL